MKKKIPFEITRKKRKALRAWSGLFGFYESQRKKDLKALDRTKKAW